MAEVLSGQDFIVKTDCRCVWWNNREDTSGIWPVGGWKRFGRWTFLPDRRHIWIRFKSGMAERAPQEAAKRAGVAYSRMAIKELDLDRIRGYRVLYNGVVVRFQDACKVIIELYPGIVELERADIYDNDDH